jgi:hypothetical protein
MLCDFFKKEMICNDVSCKKNFQYLSLKLCVGLCNVTTFQTIESGRDSNVLLDVV